MKILKIGLLLSAFLVSSCFSGDGPSFPEGEVMGFRPIYENEVDLEIAMLPVRSVINSGKIHLINDLVLLNEISEGIHFIDNSDPSNPQPIKFLKVKGSTDMAVKDGVLYINQYNDMLAIDFQDLENWRLLSRTEGLMNSNSSDQFTPSGFGNYFECLEEGRGRVVGWQFTTLNSPKCYK